MFSLKERERGSWDVERNVWEVRDEILILICVIYGFWFIIMFIVYCEGKSIVIYFFFFVYFIYIL